MILAHIRNHVILDHVKELGHNLTVCPGCFLDCLKILSDILLLLVHTVQGGVISVDIAVTHKGLGLAAVEGDLGSLDKGRIPLFHSIRRYCDSHTTDCIIELSNHCSVNSKILVDGKPA